MEKNTLCDRSLVRVIAKIEALVRIRAKKE